MQTGIKRVGGSLSPDCTLWHNFKARGCQKARAALIERYAHLASITAGRIVSGMPTAIDRDDLAGFGMIGLIKAVDQFDAGREIKFETYAITLIRGAIYESLRQLDWMPRHLRNQQKLLEKAYRRFRVREKRDPQPEEWAAEAGVSEAQLYKLQRLLAREQTCSLEGIDKPMGSGDLPDLRDIIASEEDTFASVYEHEQQRQLQCAMEALPEREAQTINFYYFNDLTLREIAEKLGVSESRAYQLRAQALSRLQRCLGDRI